MLLIIDRSQRDAEAIRDICYYLGILSEITTPDKASFDISNRFRAVLVIEPESIVFPERLIESMRIYSLGAPVFALIKNGCGNEGLLKLFDGIFDRDGFGCDGINAIISYQRERGQRTLGDYRLMGIDASTDTKEATFFDDPIGFTKTETMILRYLISCYPNHACSTDILKFSFKASRMPEPSSIRTHISVINKKFLRIAGRPLIVSEARVGYRITTPLLEERMANEKEKIKV